MVSATQPVRRVQFQVPPWPPDDTEESVMGTDFHQMTIINLRLGINEVAHTLRQPGQPVPWHALSQTMITGFTRPDGSRYTTLPDVFVYRQTFDQTRGSLAIGVDGPPILVVEVLSDATYEADLDLDAGKGYSYAAAGVEEYLTLDPTGRNLPERVRAWRLINGVFRPWEADCRGRWHSERLGFAIALEGEFVAVYADQGRRMLREGEIEEDREQARLDREQARIDREQARLDRERLEAELARRDEQLAEQAEELARLRSLLGDRGKEA